MAARFDGRPRAICPGAGHRAVAAQPALLITPDGADDPPGLVLAHEFLALGFPSELTVLDVLTSEHRRVGAIHDPSELRTGHVRSSGCPMPTIELNVGDTPAELARIRAWRSRFLRAEPEIRVRVLELSMTERARQTAGDRAGLRLLDRRADVDAPDLKELHRAGRKPGSQLWRELEALRARHALAGFLIRSHSTRSTTLILNLHALEALLEDGLAEISITDQGCPREDVFGHTTALDHMQQFVAWTGAWTSELERLAGQAKRLGLIVLRFAWQAKTAALMLLAIAWWALRLAL